MVAGVVGAWSWGHFGWSITASDWMVRTALRPSPLICSPPGGTVVIQYRPQGSMAGCRS